MALSKTIDQKGSVTNDLAMEEILCQLKALLAEREIHTIEGRASLDSEGKIEPFFSSRLSRLATFNSLLPQIPGLKSKHLSI
jgi:hypothetical protein